MMKNKTYILTLSGLLLAGGLSAQTLSEAQKMFLNGEFAQAKPVFQRLVKQSPSNANYNFWYGACCYETGELQESIPYLEKSAARKVINAYLYLGKAYYDTYRFDEAVDNLEEHISWLEKKKRDTAEAEELLEKFRIGSRMFRGVEKVAVIDSFVVDKTDFLQAYKLSPQAGEIKFTGEGTCTSFTNEMGDKMLLAKENEEGQPQLYAQSMLIDHWGDPERLNSLNETGTNLNYPFVDSDGITVYYAAQGGDNLGGYDIFVTRYDSEDNTYLRPDNIGMPFNSPYNDYMYAIDDFNNLGWFASDRFQPEGKVCIYVFAPNDSKEVYDYDLTGEEQLATYASLKNIQATWGNADKVRLAKQQLAKAMYQQQHEQKAKGDFTFIINDGITYHVLDDFQSKEARKLYQELSQKQKDLEAMKRSLNEQRDTYASAQKSRKDSMTPAILDQEKRIQELYKEIEKLTFEVRNTELKARS